MPQPHPPAHPPSLLLRLAHRLSPTAWLVVVAASAALAGGSALLLAIRTDSPSGEVPAQAFDSLEQFVRDTIRLSFKERLYNDTSDAVYVAPKGILNPNAALKWIAPVEAVEPSGDSAPPQALAIAPPRVLDPAWEPPFPVISSLK